MYVQWGGLRGTGRGIPVGQEHLSRSCMWLKAGAGAMGVSKGIVPLGSGVRSDGKVGIGSPGAVTSPGLHGPSGSGGSMALGRCVWSVFSVCASLHCLIFGGETLFSSRLVFLPTVPQRVSHLPARTHRRVPAVDGRHTC